MKRAKKYHKLKKIFYVSFFLFILLFFLFSTNKKFDYLETANPIPTLYRQVISGEGYLILDEEVFTSKGTGVAVYNVQEGEKVPKSYPIMNVNLLQDNSNIKDQLIQVQAAIDYKNDTPKDDKENTNLSVEEINIIRNIQKFIRNESYEKLISSINSLDLHTKHSVNISELNELLMLPLEELENRKEKLAKTLSTTDNEYFSNKSGIVSFVVDDYKGYLNANKEFNIFTNKYLKSFEEKSYESGKSRVIKGESLFRIINNVEWYMAVNITDKSLIKYKIGDTIILKMGDDDLLNGSILKYNIDSNGNVVLIVGFQNNLADYYSVRKRDVKIIKNESQSFTIPSSSVIENENGMIGVYIQEIHGLVQFIPVNIIGETREEVYISRGDKNNQIKVGSKHYKTLTISDNVIVSPEKVLKEQIIN